MFTIINFLIKNFIDFFRGREREKNRDRERHRGIGLLFHLFMHHSLVDSSLCSDQVRDPQTWYIYRDLDSLASHRHFTNAAYEQ